MPSNVFLTGQKETLAVREKRLSASQIQPGPRNGKLQFSCKYHSETKCFLHWIFGAPHVPEWLLNVMVFASKITISQILIKITEMLFY